LRLGVGRPFLPEDSEVLDMGVTIERAFFPVPVLNTSPPQVPPESD
jgi:hypothetical protein